jgi:hypothetical protein
VLGFLNSVTITLNQSPVTPFRRDHAALTGTSAHIPAPI